MLVAIPNLMNKGEKLNIEREKKTRVYCIKLVNKGTKLPLHTGMS